MPALSIPGHDCVPCDHFKLGEFETEIIDSVLVWNEPNGARPEVDLQAMRIEQVGSQKTLLARSYQNFDLGVHSEPTRLHHE